MASSSSGQSSPETATQTRSHFSTHVNVRELSALPSVKQPASGGDGGGAPPRILMRQKTSDGAEVAWTDPEEGHMQRRAIWTPLLQLQLLTYWRFTLSCGRTAPLHSQPSVCNLVFGLCQQISSTLNPTKTPERLGVEEESSALHEWDHQIVFSQHVVSCPQKGGAPGFPSRKLRCLGSSCQWFS